MSILVWNPGTCTMVEMCLTAVWVSLLSIIHWVDTAATIATLGGGAGQPVTIVSTSTDPATVGKILTQGQTLNNIVSHCVVSLALQYYLLDIYFLAGFQYPCKLHPHYPWAVYNAL